MHSDYQFFIVLCFRCSKCTIKICFINLEISNFFHEFFTTFPHFFSLSMNICFSGFYWINPSLFIETKIYVKHYIKDASTTFLSSKIWYHFLTIELSNKAMKNQVENKNRKLTLESPEKNSGFYVFFYFI